MKRRGVHVYSISEKDKCPQFSFKMPTFLEVRPLNLSKVESLLCVLKDLISF